MDFLLCPYQYSFTVKGNILSLSDETGESADFTIRKLSSKDMELTYSEEFTEGNPAVVYKSTQELYLSK